VLAPADADRVLAASPGPVELARTVAIVGQPRRVHAGTSTSFVSDYDVEVAQSAAISDPIVRVLRQGLDFSASVGHAADGRLLIRFGCLRSALAEPVTARTVASTRLGDIQLPKVASTLFAASGLIEDGGALVARHEGGLGAGTMVRIKRARAAAGPSPAVAHQVVFAEDLLGQPMRVPIPSVRDDQRKPGETPAEPHEPLIESSEGGALSTDMVAGLVARLLGEDGDTRFDIVGTRIHVQGTEEKAAAVRNALAGLAKGVSRNLVVDLRFGKLEGQRIPDDLDALAARLPVAASVPIALFDQFLVAGGLEQSAIIDQDVEIAQQAQIADPIVAPLFTGYVASGIASAAGSDRVELLLDLQHQEALQWPHAGFPSRAENVGSVDLPQIDGTYGRHRLLLERGRWSIAAVANPGESRALVILVRVR
jgi:hypothetical protein